MYPRRVRGSGLAESARGEAIGSFVLRVAVVALDPVPFDLVPADRQVQRLPEVGVLDRLLRRGQPAVALPAEDPLGDAVAYVHAVGVQADRHRPGQALQRLDRGGQLHPVVRGQAGVAAAQLLLVNAVAQQRAPAARSRVAAAGAVGPDVHGHGGSPYPSPAAEPGNDSRALASSVAMTATYCRTRSGSSALSRIRPSSSNTAGIGARARRRRSASVSVSARSHTVYR